MRILLVATFLSLALSGCGTAKFTGGAGAKLVASEGLPPPSRADMFRSDDFAIAAYDRVSVVVFGIPELSIKVVVDGTGRIVLPIAGPVLVAGKTVEGASEAVRAQLVAAHVRDPKVSVNIDEVNQHLVVEGAVTEPGRIQVAGRMTLTRAIAASKGLSEFASDEFVVVFRRVDNQELAALYDLRSIRAGLYPDPQLYPNDLVSVSESRGRRLFKDVINSSGLLSIPVLLLR